MFGYPVVSLRFLFASLSGWLIVILYEIVDRKRADEVLQQSEKKFRDMAELLPQVVFEFDSRDVSPMSTALH